MFIYIFKFFSDDCEPIPSTTELLPSPDYCEELSNQCFHDHRNTGLYVPFPYRGKIFDDLDVPIGTVSPSDPLKHPVPLVRVQFRES